MSINCVRVDILVFAAVRDRLLTAGCQSNTNESGKFQVSLPSSWPTGGHLRGHLCRQLWPVLADIEASMALALNLQYVDLTADGPLTLVNGDTLALIPPISGG